MAFPFRVASALRPATVAESPESTIFAPFLQKSSERMTTADPVLSHHDAIVTRTRSFT
jgi:hypothetical protein